MSNTPDIAIEFWRITIYADKGAPNTSVKSQTKYGLYPRFFSPNVINSQKWLHYILAIMVYHSNSSLNLIVKNVLRWFTA